MRMRVSVIPSVATRKEGPDSYPERNSKAKEPTKIALDAHDPVVVAVSGKIKR